MGTFIAKWSTECAACGERVSKGQEAAYNMEGDVVHVDCPSTESDIIGTHVDACPRCQVMKPCYCD